MSAAGLALKDPSEGERMLALARLLGSHGREVECRVEGDSMAGTFPHADRIRIRFEPGEALTPGHIAAFVAGRRIIAHRVLRRGACRAARGYLLTAGDATLLPDPPVSLASILGRVVAVREGEVWIAPPALPRVPLWRKGVRSALNTAVSAAMEISVPLAAGVAAGLIRIRRLFRSH